MSISSLHKFAIQQAPVGFNLHFQTSLDVQELLVLGVLALHVSPDLEKLRLQVPDLHLDLGQLSAVTAFRFC